MGECEVCLDEDATGTVTFNMAGADEVAVAFCPECVTAVLTAMNGRYHSTIERHNAEVDAIMKMLGMEWPS